MCPKFRLGRIFGPDLSPFLIDIYIYILLKTTSFSPSSSVNIHYITSCVVWVFQWILIQYILFTSCLFLKNCIFHLQPQENIHRYKMITLQTLTMRSLIHLTTTPHTHTTTHTLIQSVWRAETLPSTCEVKNNINLKCSVSCVCEETKA